jgi:predicted RNase H-like nuclease (RuvC/YqgF family)
MNLVERLYEGECSRDLIIEADARIEQLERENAQLKAAIAKQKEVIEHLSATVRTCDELSRLAKVKRDDQAALIETLAEALNIVCEYDRRERDQPFCLGEEALQQYELWRTK